MKHISDGTLEAETNQLSEARLHARIRQLEHENKQLRSQLDSITDELESITAGMDNHAPAEEAEVQS